MKTFRSQALYSSTQAIALRNRQHTDLDLQDELYKVDAICGCKEDIISKGLRAIMAIPVGEKKKKRKELHRFHTDKEAVLSGHLWIRPNIKSQSLYEGVHLRLLILDQSVSRVLVGVSYEKKNPKINQILAVKKVSLRL